MKTAIIEAANRFQNENDGELPDVLYAQRYSDDSWRIEFATDNAWDSKLTRWDSGDDVTKLYNDALADDEAEVVFYASNIEAGWDDDWTNAA